MNFLIIVIYIFSILRLPYAILPYIIKLGLIGFLRNSFSLFWESFPVQVIRVVGDILNLLLTSWLFNFLIQNHSFFIILRIVFIAEFVRLLCEKGIMMGAAFWQALPHRKIAKFLDGKSIFQKYVRYYILSDEKRLKKSLSRLKALARFYGKKQTLEKLRYVSSFQIVPDNFPLRSGYVRNIAHGEVFVHAKWSSCPDILRGLALRRSPWIFDPRYLRRPFYYRTEANPLMTRFVFENARFCLLFSVYQFGHEIKSARYEIFYKLMRAIGLDFEQPIRQDGTHNFDVFAKRIFYNETKIHSLKSIEEVVEDFSKESLLHPLQIADKYQLPMIFVEEVLLQKFKSISANLLE
ncbi:MAG: hypothetical protein U0Z26_15555 [Anaerolineales bacterium]